MQRLELPSQRQEAPLKPIAITRSFSNQIVRGINLPHTYSLCAEDGDPEREAFAPAHNFRPCSQNDQALLGYSTHIKFHMTIVQHHNVPLA